MNIVNKELAEKLNEFSKVVHKISDLTKKEKNIEETILEGPLYEQNKEIIQMFNEEVMAVKQELKDSIKELKTDRDLKKDEIMAVVAEQYETPFKAKLPEIGSISATWEEVPYLNNDLIDKKETIEMLIRTGNLDCISIVEDKYIEASNKSDEKFPGIETKQESKIVIRG